MNVLVSIVIPAYNHAGYLAEAIRSVLAQDYPHVELIVIDDGSTDNTRQVLSSLDGDFHWETQANAGQSRTLANGWSKAKGEILGYLSADDILSASAVSEAVAAFHAHPDVVATYCDFELIDPQSRIVRRVQTPDFSYEDMLVNVDCPVGPGAFFRRAAYESAGPWNSAYRQMPDYDFWLRLGLSGPFLRIPKVLAGFRVHEGSQTYSQTSPERAAEPVDIVEGVLARAKASGLSPVLARAALANANLVSAQLHIRAGRFGTAMRNISIALRQSASAVLSLKMIRLLANAIFNRFAHRLLWRMRNALFRGKHS